MSDRVITVVLTIKDPEAAKAFWDKHMEPEGLIHGCRVDCIANGDKVDLCEDAMAMLPEADYRRLTNRER